jgi:hypothetical protein
MKKKYAPYKDDVKKIRDAVYSATKTDNVEKIRHLLTDNNFPNMPKAIKESIILGGALDDFDLFNVGEKIVLYLIFDYKIDESIFEEMKDVCINIKNTEDMFAKRRLTEQLNLELKNNLKEIKKNKI